MRSRDLIRGCTPSLRLVLCGVLFFWPIATVVEAQTTSSQAESQVGAPESAEANPFAPDVAEPGTVELIREYTTSAEYLPATASYVPASDVVPSPTQILGHLVGAPDELTSVARIHDYFRGVAAASDRVRVDVIGTSEEGREILLATVSSEENLGRLARLQEITARLADPRSTTREEMESLAAEGLPIYHLMGGLHSPETGSPEMLMELVYRLAVSERPEIQRIRDKVVVLITPVVEVDGRDRQVEWYYRHLRGRDLEFEQLREFSSPPYWGHYVYHDNNRDGIQTTLALTRAINGVYWRYHPQVVHDLHESVPLLYLSSGHGPYTLAVDPITVNEWTLFAYNEATALQALGLPGVWTWAFWDGWWPGYLFSVANNHNSIGRFYETFGNSLAGTFEREPGGRKYAGKEATEVQWYRAWPPDDKLAWSLRNNVNYMQAGVLEALQFAATQGPSLLRNFWVKGERAVAMGRSEAPYAWVFPLQQRDPRRLDYLVNRLLEHRIEVHRLREAVDGADDTYGIGTYVVRMDQPYRRAALNFLEEQKFPADEPNSPYDDVAWTWPLLYGVDGAQVDDSEVLSAAMDAVLEPVSTPGWVEGAGAVYVLRDTGQTALMAAAVRLGGHRIRVAEEPFRAGGLKYPVGSWLVQAPRAVIEGVAEQLGLVFNGVDTAPDVPTHDLDLPRLAVLHTWTSTQDTGWVRYTLDVEEIPYTLISDDDVKRGGLSRRFDVIVFPNVRGDFARLVHGVDPAHGPLAYTQTPEYPSHGRPDASPDITGGIGFAGLLNLQEFIEQGGVLVALGNAGVLPVDGGLVRRVNQVPRSSFSSPGSEVQARVLRSDHPLTYGYPEVPSIFRGNLPIFDVGDRDRSRVVLQFGVDVKESGEDEEVEEEEAGDVVPEAAADDRSEIATEEPIEVEPPAAEEAILEEEDLGEASTDVSAKGENDAMPPRKGLVLSGFVRGESVLAGKPAILDIPVSDGRVLLYSFNPMHRYLNHSDFRWLYNALLNWNDLPPE